MTDEIEIHDCKACGVRQRVDELAKTDRTTATQIVVDVCTKCSDHPNAKVFEPIAQRIGTELVSNCQPRVDE